MSWGLIKNTLFHHPNIAEDVPTFHQKHKETVRSMLLKINSDYTLMHVIFCPGINILNFFFSFFSSKVPFSVFRLHFSLHSLSPERSQRDGRDPLTPKKHQHQHSRQGLPQGRDWQEKQAPELVGWKRMGINEQVAGFPANTRLTQVVCFVCVPTNPSPPYREKCGND